MKSGDLQSKTRVTGFLPVCKVCESWKEVAHVTHSTG